MKLFRSLLTASPAVISLLLLSSIKSITENGDKSINQNNMKSSSIFGIQFAAAQDCDTICDPESEDYDPDTCDQDCDETGDDGDGFDDETGDDFDDNSLNNFDTNAFRVASVSPYSSSQYPFYTNGYNDGSRRRRNRHRKVNRRSRRQNYDDSNYNYNYNYNQNGFYMPFLTPYGGQNYGFSASSMRYFGGYPYSRSYSSQFSPIFITKRRRPNVDHRSLNYGNLAVLDDSSLTNTIDTALRGAVNPQFKISHRNFGNEAFLLSGTTPARTTRPSARTGTSSGGSARVGSTSGDGSS